MRRWLRVALIIGLATQASACIVVHLEPFYDVRQLTYDARLNGTWLDPDDGLTVTVEPGEWRSYRISYQHATDAGTLTGYLFQDARGTFLDLTPGRGRDDGPFLVPVHGLAQITFDDAGDRVSLQPLSYDAFRAGGSAALPTLRSQREQLILAAPIEAVREWLQRAAGDPTGLFGPTVSFQRQAGTASPLSPS